MLLKSMSAKRAISVSADLAVILAAAIFIWSSARTRIGSSPALDGDPVPGMSFSSVYSGWKQERANLILFLNRECKYCTESAAFYKRLVSEGVSRVNVIVLFPHDARSGREYLSQLGLSVSDVRGDIRPPWRRLRTPSLILCDSKGIIKHVWIGKLSVSEEQDVLLRLGGAAAPGSRPNPDGGS